MIPVEERKPYVDQLTSGPANEQRFGVFIAFEKIDTKIYQTPRHQQTSKALSRKTSAFVTTLGFAPFSSNQATIAAVH